MTESAKQQSDTAPRREKQKPDARPRDRDSSADNSKTGEQAQKDAALSQPPYPGEPAGGE